MFIIRYDFTIDDVATMIHMQNKRTTQIDVAMCVSYKRHVHVAQRQFINFANLTERRLAILTWIFNQAQRFSIAFDVHFVSTDLSYFSLQVASKFSLFGKSFYTYFFTTKNRRKKMPKIPHEMRDPTL